jgi:hypothetical protein
MSVVLRITPQFKVDIDTILCNVANKNNINNLRKNSPTEYQFVLSLLFDLIDNIIAIFHINDVNSFQMKLQENNYRDIWGLFYLLFPFISNKDQLSTISKLDDLYK